MLLIPILLLPVVCTHGSDLPVTIADEKLAGAVRAAEQKLRREFEREQICERTRAGMAAAKRRGVHVGRPRKLTRAQVTEASRRIRAEEISVAHVAYDYDVSPSTLRRELAKAAG